MTNSASAPASAFARHPAARLAVGFERASFVLFAVALAWAPFPLGSNRPWSWSLLCLLIAMCWLLWLASIWTEPRAAVGLSRGLAGPLVLGVLALCWGAVQVVPVVPRDWANPVWQLADGVLGTHTRAVISLNPWRTESELMKLLSYAMAAWLARVFAGRPDRARVLLHVLIGIGGFYAAYALVMASLGIPQFNVFYAAPATSRDVSGPFVNHNSYATYAGLMTLCAGVRLVEAGWVSVSAAKGLRRFALMLLHYLFGRGVPYLVAAALALSTLIATASRAGNFAALAGMVSLLVFCVVIGVRQSTVRWVGSVAVATFAGIVVLFAINGDFLAARFNDMAGSGIRDDTRLMLWNAALHMIHDAPLLGFGLGTYENAYPMYADTMMRFVMDKAHNDYLELAAGWGLPAAILWWSSLAWLMLVCVRGVFVRRRHRVYPMLAIGATVLVGVHSVFDFSLQMPAVALAYAAILGLGVAQAFPTRNETGRRKDASASAAAARHWLARVALALPALAVVAAGVPRFVTGLAREAAFPATAYIAMNVALPPASYSAAERILSYASPDDGETQIARAEAAVGAREPPAVVIPIAAAALSRASASARGWILLADLLRDRDAVKAAAALTLALELGPHEYYLVSPRVQAGAPLWKYLPRDARETLLGDTHLLLANPDFHGALRALLRTPGGPALVTRALAGRPDELRALNRSLARERLGL